MNERGPGIVLIGFPSCGKSAVGRDLAGRLRREFVDADDALAARFAREQGRKLSVRDIFRTVGEENFRRMETETLRFLAQSSAGAVIATGGGAPMRPENLPLLAALGCIVYLCAPLDVCLARMDSGKGRPAFLRGPGGGERAKQLWKERDAVYARIADIRIASGGQTVTETVETILRSGGWKVEDSKGEEVSGEGRKSGNKIC